MKTYTEAQKRLMNEVDAEVSEVLVRAFGKQWAADPEPPSSREDEVNKVREAFAIPATQGAMNAVARFAMITAPESGTRGQLGVHLGKTVDQAEVITASSGLPFGHFWKHVGAYLAKART